MFALAPGQGEPGQVLLRVRWTRELATPGVVDPDQYLIRAGELK